MNEKRYVEQFRKVCQVMKSDLIRQEVESRCGIDNPINERVIAELNRKIQMNFKLTISSSMRDI